MKTIENPEIDLRKYAQLIFDEDTKQFSEGRMNFQQMVLEHLDIHRCRGEGGTLDLNLTPYKN